VVRFTLTPDERHMIAIRRAFAAYVLERTRFDPTDEDPDREEMQYLELHNDGGGRLMVQPGNVNLRAFRAVIWYTMAEGAGKIDAARSALEKERIERETQRRRRFGDPRRGRVAPPRATG
jgi:hypothetical protein